MDSEWVACVCVWAHIWIKRPQTATPGNYKQKQANASAEPTWSRTLNECVCEPSFHIMLWWLFIMYFDATNTRNDKAFTLYLLSSLAMFTWKFIRKTDCFSIHNLLLYVFIEHRRTVGTGQDSVVSVLATKWIDATVGNSYFFLSFRNSVGSSVNWLRLSKNIKRLFFFVLDKTKRTLNIIEMCQSANGHEWTRNEWTYFQFFHLLAQIVQMWNVFAGLLLSNRITIGRARIH